MGQTAAEAKREIDQTRAHLSQTLEAIQLRARRNLDLRRQLQSNRTVQAALTLALLIVAGLALVVTLRNRRLTPAERLARRLKLRELRSRVQGFRQGARAWSAGRRRLLKAEPRKARGEAERQEGIARRLLVSVAEAALTAFAAGYVKRMLDQSRAPHERAHPTGATVSRRR